MKIFELHYYLTNNQHSMNAFVKNKAEAELLKIFKEVSDVLALELSFEIEALEQGGIREFFKVLNHEKNNQKIFIILTFLGTILSGIIIDVAGDYLKKDNELEKLQKEEIRLNIKKLNRELGEETSEADTLLIVKQMIFLFGSIDKVKFHKSNFYATLLKESKIEKISSTELDEDYKPITLEKFIDRSDFKKNINEEVKIESQDVEHAIIEIVSPVLKKGKIKWKGIYDSKSISFNLMDKDFKKSVLNREISFTSGTAIECRIEFIKEMDDDGNLKITEINIYDVDNILQGNEVIPAKKVKKIKLVTSQIAFDFK
jgi:hypothetical protein